MTADPSTDPVHALVPHSPKQPIEGSGSGPLKGRTFMIKDMFAVKGLKVSNGNPGFYEIVEPANETAPAVPALLDQYPGDAAGDAPTQRRQCHQHQADAGHRLSAPHNHSHPW